MLRFLFLDRQFPCALVRCLDAIGERLAALKRPSDIVEHLREFIAKVEATPVAELGREELHAFVDALQLQLIELHGGDRGDLFSATPDASAERLARFNRPRNRGGMACRARRWPRADAFGTVPRARPGVIKTVR